MSKSIIGILISALFILIIASYSIYNEEKEVYTEPEIIPESSFRVTIISKIDSTKQYYDVIESIKSINEINSNSTVKKVFFMTTDSNYYYFDPELYYVVISFN